VFNHQVGVCFQAGELFEGVVGAVVEGRVVELDDVVEFDPVCGGRVRAQVLAFEVGAEHGVVKGQMVLAAVDEAYFFVGTGGVVALTAQRVVVDVVIVGGHCRRLEWYADGYRAGFG